jgi:hypothetical protein
VGRHSGHNAEADDNSGLSYSSLIDALPDNDWDEFSELVDFLDSLGICILFAPSFQSDAS